MVPLDSKLISENLFDFLRNSKNPALFAGAGVGARAGLPTWPQLMENLASVADTYEAKSGEIIRQRTRNGHYTSAAVIYKSIPEMPIGEKYKQISTPFLIPPHPDKLRALVSLPFRAIFTTNYDNSLHNAFSYVVRMWPRTIELDDATMRQGPFIKNFYIARIHGRAEVPEGIVFAEDDYQRLLNNDCYIDFTRHILTNYNCLFLGFSFVDPAIENILQIIERRLSPNFPELHVAYLQADADKQLKSRLSRFNIKLVEYEVSDNHSTLWDGITIVSRKFPINEKIEKPEANFPTDNIKRFIATSYARIKLDNEIQPLQEMVIDGIILDLLSKDSERGLSFESVANALREILALSIEESRRLIKRRIEILSGRGWCHVDDGIIKTSKDISYTLRNDINVLVSGIMDRAAVREGERIPELYVDISTKCIEELLIARGWDLGAHFAQSKTGELPSILTTISVLVEKHGVRLSGQQREKLILAFYDLFQNPDETESTILASLGRSSFALQVVINSPCTTIAHPMVLPEYIYLDASFLMPAIVEGHPLHSLYLDALNRYREASEKIDLDISIYVAESFLNEIISHREIAIRDIDELSIGDKNQISNYVQLYGVENTNVFIGAYINSLDQIGRDISFNEFLNHYAPYRTEQELAQYLKSVGIKSLQLDFKPDNERRLYEKINKALIEAYHNDARTQYNRKELILIEHEARQLTQLTIDRDKGLKSIFVSADTRLRRLALRPILEGSGKNIISNRGLIQLIDMLVGLKSDPAVTSRLLWGSIVTDETTMVRDYLINLALQYRDEAMTMSLPEVLEEVVPKEIEAAKEKGVSFSPYSTSESKLRTVRFLGVLEDRFYENMAEVICRKFPEEYNLAKETHRNHLMKSIEKTQKAIKEYESKLEKTENPKEREIYKSEIIELQTYLQDYLKAIETFSA